MSATGVNGIGVFAQAAGYGTADVVVGNGLSTVTVTGGSDSSDTGAVGGSGGAAEAASSTSAAIWIDRPGGPHAGDGSVVYDSWITINAGGIVTNAAGSGGTAIKVTGGGTIALANYGSITGNLDLNAVEDAGNWTPGPWTPGPLNPRGGLLNARGSLNNYGTWVPGVRANADILNQGTIAFDNPKMQTRVYGRFNQTASGILSPMIDSLNGNTSLLKIDGNASVDGTILPNAITLLPGTVPVLTAGTVPNYRTPKSLSTGRLRTRSYERRCCSLGWSAADPHSVTGGRLWGWSHWNTCDTCHGRCAGAIGFLAARTSPTI